jgi:hypothetical protein
LTPSLHGIASRITYDNLKPIVSNTVFTKSMLAHLLHVFTHGFNEIVDFSGTTIFGATPHCLFSKVIKCQSGAQFHVESEKIYTHPGCPILSVSIPMRSLGWIPSPAIPAPFTNMSRGEGDGKFGRDHSYFNPDQRIPSPEKIFQSVQNLTSTRTQVKNHCSYPNFIFQQNFDTI